MKNWIFIGGALVAASAVAAYVLFSNDERKLEVDVAIEQLTAEQKEILSKVRLRFIQQAMTD